MSAQKKLSTTQKIKKAISLFRRFRLEEPEHIDTVSLEVPEVAMLIGECDGVLYTTYRNGKKEQYIHEFNDRSKPILISGWDGKNIFLVGGKYNFTQDGITDNG